MKVIAFDQATFICGYCIMEDDRIIDYGSIRPPRTLCMSKRVHYIVSKAKVLLSSCKVDTIALEQVQDQKSPATLIGLAKLLGAMEYVSMSACDDVQIISPSSWRSVYGFGNNVDGKKPNREMLKSMAISYVKEHFGLDVSEDEAEAILIALAVGKITVKLKPKKRKVTKK